MDEVNATSKDHPSKVGTYGKFTCTRSLIQHQRRWREDWDASVFKLGKYEITAFIETRILISKTSFEIHNYPNP